MIVVNEKGHRVELKTLVDGEGGSPLPPPTSERGMRCFRQENALPFDTAKMNLLGVSRIDTMTIGNQDNPVRNRLTIRTTKLNANDKAFTGQAFSLNGTSGFVQGGFGAPAKVRLAA